MKRKHKFFSGRSMFLKYMNMSVIIVFLSFLILGIILTMTISQYWYNEKHSTLTARADNIAEYLRMNVKGGGVHGEADAPFRWINDTYAQHMGDFLHVYASDMNSDIIIVDNNAHVIMAVSDNPRVKPGVSLHSESVDKALSQNIYFEKGTLGGIYSEDRYISTKVIHTSSGFEAVGAVIVTTDTKDIDNFTGMVMQIFILAAIATLSMSILAIGVFSYNMVKPLKQMSSAAKQFGKGDFSVRVTASGNDEIKELAVAFNNMAESLSSSEDYYLHIVSDEIKRLSRLVRSMLDLSRIDSGELKLNFQNFDLLGVLVHVILTFEQEIDRKNIEIRGLDAITPKNVYGDKDLLHQVVYNLVENAVKFTNEGGYIAFDIVEQPEQFDFIIRNSGMGIKSNEIDLIFGRFYKTDKSRSKDKKGLGLGLYLVRSIIRLHGGNISAKSVVGDYTEFDFYLPKKSTSKKQK